jgi:hypothetical protein
VPPNTALRQKDGRDSGPRTEAVLQLLDLVEPLCGFQRTGRGKLARGVKTYR